MTAISNLHSQLAQILPRMDAKSISQLKITQPLQERFNILLEKSRNKSLTNTEQDEVNHYIAVERLIRLAKIKAQQTNNSK